MFYTKFQTGANSVSATPTADALATTADFTTVHPTVTAPTDIFLCNQASGAPVNGGTGNIAFDVESGIWTYQQAFTGGGVGMRSTTTGTRWRDSDETHSPIGTGAFTQFWIGEIKTAPTADLAVMGKKGAGTPFPGVSLTFRNDGQIIGLFDPGAGSSGFENIDQGDAADLVAVWAVALIRNASDEEQIFIRKAGGSVQASAASVRTDDYDASDAFWSLGDVGFGSAADAIHKSFWRFSYGITEAEFTTLTAHLA